MKKMMRRLLWMLVLMALNVVAVSGQITIRILSDPHVLAPEYAAQCKTKSMNLLPLSADIFEAAVTQVINEKEDNEETLLLIPGDLTSNGEQLSHQFVVSQLNRLKDACVETMVIPGNHDIFNKYAASSLTAKGEKGKMISRADFKAMYNDFGYGTADDVCGLSYVKRLGSRLAIICLDDILEDGGQTYYSDGTLSEATLVWMKKQASQLQSEGRAVIAMVHNQVLEHFCGEEQYFPDRMLNTSAEYNGGITNADVRKAFADAGIQYVFTGHFHTQDAQRMTVEDSQGVTRMLYDISTGSLSASKGHIRKLVFSDDYASLNISGTNVTLPRDKKLLAERGVTDWREGQSYEEYSLGYLREYTKGFLNSYIGKVGIKNPFFQKVAEQFATELSVVVDDFYLGTDGGSAYKVDMSQMDALSGIFGSGLTSMYKTLDSMVNNYVGNPANVTPDTNIPNLQVEVVPSAVEPIRVDAPVKKVDLNKIADGLKGFLNF